MSGNGGLGLSVALLGPEFRRWLRELERIGGCSSPVLLMGHTITRDRATGTVVHEFRSADLPFGVLMLPCRNRRQEVCLPCSLLHNGDSFQIVRTGLSGGKGISAEVSTHPRAFVTVTAPSFGLVHRAANGAVCHPRRDEPVCPHGRRLWCRARHSESDTAVGAALCPECYDFVGAVIWNASAGALWNRYTNRLGREVAKLAGLTVRTNEIRSHLRISYVKVSEFQRRGSVHFHAVVRLDGPDGAEDQPPAWASTGLLIEAARAAGPRVSLVTPSGDGGTRTLRLGVQLDAREIGGADGGLSDSRVGSYIAKYVTKGGGGGLVLPRVVSHRGWIERAPLTDHARRLMLAAWDCGGLAELEPLHLRQWCHQLGFRGNVVTKSMRYSTTYGALREARAAFRREASGIAAIPLESTEVESNWRFVGAGLSPALAEIAAGIADETAIRKGPRPEWLDLQAGEAL